MNRYALPILAMMAAAGLATAVPASAQPAGTPCHVRGIADLATCHRIEVPEDRSRPDGRTIGLHVAVLPARGSAKAPDSALFLLAGGPGQAATDMGPLVAAALSKVRESRPIVLMDQRGTGRSHPLRCTLPTEAEASMAGSADQLVAALTACRQGWDADLRRYSTLDVVEDVETVRRTLGLRQLDLWGGSWGTRTALLYMRTYPASVRTAVLDGVTAPNDLLLPGEPAHSQAALDALFAACAADAACAEAHPDLGPRFAGWLDGLSAGGTATYVDGAAGERRVLTMDRDGVAQAVRGTLYSTTGAARLPHALERLMAGDATALLPLTLGAGSVVRDTMFMGATLASLCREEVPRAAGVRSAAGFTGTSWLDGWRAMCDGVEVDPLPPGYADPVTVDVPVLLLSGALDPITPPASAELALAHLPRVWHLVAPHAGHIVSGAAPCVGDLIAGFVAEASGAGLDGACLARRGRPPFMTGPMGPTP